MTTKTGKQAVKSSKPKKWSVEASPEYQVRATDDKGIYYLIAMPEVDGKANAHLIASAPEMYDLLKKYHEIIPTPESTALLAKAEGRA